MSIRTTLTIAVLAFGLSGAAHAVVLYTPPLRPVEGTVLFCNILNVSTSDLSGSVDLVDPFGTVHDHLVFILPPGKTIGWYGSDAMPVYCRFTVQTNNKDRVRALACMYSNEQGCFAAVPAQ